MEKTLYEQFIERLNNTPKYYDKSKITVRLKYLLDKIEGF